MIFFKKAKLCNHSGILLSNVNYVTGRTQLPPATGTQTEPPALFGDISVNTPVLPGSSEKSSLWSVPHSHPRGAFT